MTDLISVTVSDGKYTIQETEKYKWQCLRYGKPWPAFEGRQPDNLHIALAYEIAELREKLQAVDRKAEAGLCSATFGGARAFHEDIRSVIKGYA